MRIIFLILFCFSLSSYAVDLTESGLYRTTKSACSQVKVTDLHNLNADKLRAGIFPSAEFTNLLNYLHRGGVKNTFKEQKFNPDPTVNFITHNSGFNQALQECYPNDPGMQAYFHQSVVRADKAGRIVGTSALVALALVTRSAYSLLNSYLPRLYLVITKVQNFTFATYLLSLLHSDSELPMTLPKLDAALDQYSDNHPSEDLQEAKTQIQRQLTDLDQKIKACGNCQERKELSIAQQALAELLQNLRN